MAVDPISGTAPNVTSAIRQAAQSTGISFEYLLTTARIESNLNPSARASTSSAKGLYQFIDQTWLGTIKQDGTALGFGQMADAISRSSDGRYEVTDPTMRAAIMRLRSDPSASAMLAGAFTRANSQQVGSAIGRQPTDGELYIAHFLGPDGAGKLINAAASSPTRSAAAMFPNAAHANRSIFYERDGSARSVSAVYARLAGKFDTARAATFGSTQIAELAPRPPAPIPVATIPAPPPRPYVPDTAGIAQAYADANPMPMPVQTRPVQAQALPPVQAQAVPTVQASLTAPVTIKEPIVDDKPLFQAMFTDNRGTALSPKLSSLWGGQRNETAARALDLFTDSRGDIRKLFGNG